MPGLADRNNDAAYMAAFEWAGGLALRLSSLGLADLREEWDAPIAKAHREKLKADSPAIISQLIGHVKTRTAELKGA